MHDDIVCKIHGVSNVNGFKKNLFSLGKLGDLKCKIHNKNRILKRVKGNLVVTKAENIISSLYMISRGKFHNILQQETSSPESTPTRVRSLVDIYTHTRNLQHGQTQACKV